MKRPGEGLPDFIGAWLYGDSLVIPAITSTDQRPTDKHEPTTSHGRFFPKANDLLFLTRSRQTWRMASRLGKRSRSEPLRCYEEGGKPVSPPSPNDAIVAKHGGDVNKGIVIGQIRPDLERPSKGCE